MCTWNQMKHSKKRINYVIKGNIVAQNDNKLSIWEHLKWKFVCDFVVTKIKA